MAGRQMDCLEENSGRSSDPLSRNAAQTSNRKPQFGVAHTSTDILPTDKAPGPDLKLFHSTTFTAKRTEDTSGILVMCMSLRQGFSTGYCETISRAFTLFLVIILHNIIFFYYEKLINFGTIWQNMKHHQSFSVKTH
ncbi:hypothetical protein WA026_023055 [Henosepilachna vigintioctopunctata]|uniref:Uncharacterized protein n=1 Tax=Henosepilachna vigintioctopunctata TaxID=420089 RepID=A0AAW1V210_9CUCU